MGGMRRQWTPSEQGRSEALQRGNRQESEQPNRRRGEEEKEEAIEWYKEDDADQEI